MNPRLANEGLELRETGTSGGYPLFQLLPTASRSRGAPKNLIFASSEKPDLRFRDAVNNDIEIVSNADKVLVYDRPIRSSGITWTDLQNWWQEMNGAATADAAKKSLLKRLESCLPEDSPPQRTFFRSYFIAFKDQIPSLPALIPEVWLHWDAKTVKQRGTSALARSRMDFLLLLPSDIRIVIEIDGQQHYAEGDLASPRKYSEMVAADRSLKLDGYQVYRFGGFELMQSNAEQLVASFFRRLYGRFGISITPPT